MKVLRLCCLGALVSVLVPTSSEAATNIRLGLGADYWLEKTATFQFTLGVDTPLAGPLTIGGRFGALLVTAPNTLGIPLDLVLHANLNRDVYIEGLVGPWILFQGDTFRAHGAFGFGLQGRALSFGVEVGYLSPKPTVGLRLGYRF
jgi:hypothetical protein